MSFLTCYSEPATVHYVSSFFSKATLFNFLVLTIVIVTPYLVGYRTQGFWTRLETVREQPIIEFKYETLLILETKLSDGSSGSLVWSTFPGLNNMLIEKVSPFITSREGDSNMDGINEFLEIEVRIPKPLNEVVDGIHFMLLFDYRLYKHATFQMESMAYGSYQTGKSANRFDIMADLALVLRQPLFNRVRDTRFNYEVIPRNGTTVDDYRIQQILQKYTERNVSTILENKYQLWATDDNLRDDEFTFKARIFYTEQSYECWASFWATMKWAWVQYFSIFVIVAVVVKEFQKTVYKARLFETRLILPWDKRLNQKPKPMTLNQR
ncbi:unnamed protein product [Allacma fusca]|uniref:Transmembrane protein 231 n=1 Tax=Allacma fusca TaxID=39272 RepID=A0A8J2LC33_9HEXA|nr:unnamed protein product [Allacma fusca]